MSDKIGDSADGENPPQYDDIMNEEKKEGISLSGRDNKGYATDASEVKVANGDEVDICVEEEEKTALSPEEEQMLSVLREVVRKCTHANPTKRPTAAEVLKMLKVIKLPEIED